MKKSFILGRFIITTTTQAGRAPFMDRATICHEDGRRWDGVALLLTPWKRDRYGDSLPQLALVFGRRR